jgi:hypothetical protein
MGYSPFEKRLADLQPDDLSILRTVHEGWYVEYKQEATNASSIAKALSAFANTYGGWLFYGIQEKSKEEPVAGEFIGIPTQDIDSILQRARQAVATNLTPSPHYETKVLVGPCDGIKLPKDRAIICIHVPWGPNAPYIHKSGQIYRRIGDGSEPKPETDRFVLDQLWHRSDGIKKAYKRWVKKDPELSKAEDKRPFVRILLVADRWGDRDTFRHYSAEEFKQIVGEKVAPQTAIPFDFVSTSENSLIARQSTPNRPQDIGLRWQYWFDAASEVIIPLNSYDHHDLTSARHSLDGYEQADRYINVLENQHFKDVHIVDLNQLFNIICGVINIQDRLCNNIGWAESYFGKVRLLNFWRTTPYLDIEAIVDSFERHGAPIASYEKMTMFPGFDPASFFEIQQYSDIDNVDARVILKALTIFRQVATALGVPPWHDFDNDTERSFYAELQKAGTRANEIVAKRARRMS